MAGKGTCESYAILGLVQTMIDQFVEQTADMTQPLKDIVENISQAIDLSFGLWKEVLTVRDLDRIRIKMESLSDKIPMDREYDISIFTSFILALLEDFSRKLQPRKRKAVCDLTRAVLRLHEYFAQHEDNFEHNLSGALSADAWEHESIQ